MKPLFFLIVIVFNVIQMHWTHSILFLVIHKAWKVVIIKNTFV